MAGRGTNIQLHPTVRGGGRPARHPDGVSRVTAHRPAALRPRGARAIQAATSLLSHSMMNCSGVLRAEYLRGCVVKAVRRVAVSAKTKIHAKKAESRDSVANVPVNHTSLSPALSTKRIVTRTSLPNSGKQPKKLSRLPPSRQLWLKDSSERPLSAAMVMPPARPANKATPIKNGGLGLEGMVVA
jgi:hypothetical protein